MSTYHCLKSSAIASSSSVNCDSFVADGGVLKDAEKVLITISSTLFNLSPTARSLVISVVSSEVPTVSLAVATVVEFPFLSRCIW